MTTHYISFRKQLLGRRIRLEFCIPAESRQEAKQIAAKETANMQGYRYAGAGL